MSRLSLFLLSVLLLAGCQPGASPETPTSAQSPTASSLHAYSTVPLDAGRRTFSESEAEMVLHLIEAAQSMDVIFWEQAYGNRDSLLQTIRDPQRRRVAEFNYGPWDRLHDHAPFVDGAGPKPSGANFYPVGVSRDEVEASASSNALSDPYTMVRRLPDGSLTALPYHQFFAEPMTTAAFQLRDAARLAESAAFRSFLERRADALSTGTYTTAPPAQPAALDVIIGPMSTGEDRLLGVKTAAMALVLYQNVEAQQRLDQLTQQFPALWGELTSSTEGEASLLPPRPSLRTYDVLYAAGAANAGPKPLTLSQLRDFPPESGRSVLFPNLVQAHADSLLRPLADVAIAADQRSHVTADALFDQMSFRELIRPMLPDSVSRAQETLVAGAREALAWSMATAVAGGDEAARMDAYGTGVSSLLHTLRRDTSNVRGRAALLQLSVLRSAGAITYDETTDTYAVAPTVMQEALPDLARQLMALRSTSRNERSAFTQMHGSVSPSLRATLGRLSDRPLALAFEQGPSVLRRAAPAVIQ